MITGYDPETKELRIGIGSLIDLVRLPETLVPSDDPISLQKRQRAHNGYQRKMEKEGWEKEVQVSATFRVHGITLSIRGRLDLVRRTENGTELREIKTLNGTPDFLNPVTGRPEHVLQIYFYAEALRREDPGQCGELKTELVYLGLGGNRGGSVTEYPVDIDDPDVQDLWQSLLSDVVKMIKEEDSRKELQITSLADFTFPYDSMRPGQRDMKDAVSECIRESGFLMVQAPTGTGKTASILTGALTETLPGRLTLFFLTAKNTHKAIVKETLELVRQRGVPLRAIFLDAKARVCHMGRDRCLPADCPYADDFREKVLGSGVMDDLLQMEIVHPDDLKALSGDAGVCAFELGLCISQRCDVVVCDYNYVFDPHVFLKRFFSDPNTAAACSLLIDEAANLPERARGYYSPEIRLSWIEELEKKTTRRLKRLLKPWKECFREWDLLLKGTGDKEIELPGETMVPESLSAWLEEISERTEPPEALREMVRSLTDFSRISCDDDRFHLLFRREPDDLVLQWFCTDPSDFLSDRLSACHSRVAFSATLAPFGHFGEQMGFPMEDARCMEVPYPFPVENLGVWICPAVDTRYRCRRQSIPAIVRMIREIHLESPGLWLVFFPSFSFMSDVARFMEDADLPPALEQKRSMSNDDRLDFINDIQSGTGLVFMVSGGIFAEGIDLRSPGLRGAIVVGPSLPGVDLRSKLVSHRYATKGEDGFLHTWAIPGIMRVVQAAGRLIRNREQRRALVLIGLRFTKNPYLGLLPVHWFDRGSIRILREDFSPLGLFLNSEQPETEA